jgi:arginyl-tRNA synthetase
MREYEVAFVSGLSEAAGVPVEELRPHVRVPEPERGDLSLPCFPLAKSLKKAPPQIAAAIAAGFPRDERFAKVEAAGPYVNAWISPVHLVGRVVSDLRSRGRAYLGSDIGAGQTVVMDYSSPNIAKPLGFHHLRSTMIGNAIARIHRAVGYEVMGINYLGDWGKTFGLLAQEFQCSGDRNRMEREGISYLLELYIAANKAAKEDPSYDEAARAMFLRQEQGDSMAVELWKAFREISLAEFQRIYSRLGVHFERIEGESFYRDGMDNVIERIAQTVGVREDQGALVVDMPYAEGEPPMMLKKSDGATLYATRDVAAAIDRFERFGFEKSLYVVGSEQRRHFDQLVRALTAMGCEFASRMHHVAFGRVQGMSTRQGNVVFLEQVLDEARDRARAKMQESGAAGRDLDIDTVAEQVGIGGVVFGDLKNLRTSDYTFDWDEILNPKGFTGICCQYAHARCCSMLRKAGGAPVQADLSRLTAVEEIQIVKEIARLPGAVLEAAEKLEPSLVARAVYEVTKAWNRYQQSGNNDRSLRVLSDDEPLREARLALVDAVRQSLAAGLDLLGVPTPEAM